MTDLDLTKYKALSFDCYGTLINWEAGIAAVLAPWAREQGLDLTDEELLLAYVGNEAAVERETPSALYPEVLASAFRRTGNKLGHPVSDGWARRLGQSVPDWPAFPDSASALARLARHYVGLAHALCAATSPLISSSSRSTVRSLGPAPRPQSAAPRAGTPADPQRSAAAARRC